MYLPNPRDTNPNILTMYHQQQLPLDFVRLQSQVLETLTEITLQKEVVIQTKVWVSLLDNPKVLLNLRPLTSERRELVPWNLVNVSILMK